MELTDSTASDSTRSPLCIDLNEIPSSSSSEILRDTFDIVRAYYDNPDPAPGNPAALPEEEPSMACGSCGEPEARKHVVVCDACERGFHIDCAGMHGNLNVDPVEWVCGECVSNGAKTKRWPLGVKSKQILDINASPPSDGDGEGEESMDSRRSTLINSFGGHAFAAPVAYSNLVCARNGFALQKTSGVLMHTVKVGLQELLHHTQATGRIIEEVDWGFPLGNHKSMNNTTNKLASRNTSEIFFQALEEFITERHGILDEGWHVELRRSMSSYEVYAVYCSPDGKKFNSMSEVAGYLGLMSNYNVKNIERNVDGPSPQEKAPSSKRRKSTRSFIANGFPECKESLLSCQGKEIVNHRQKTQNTEFFPSKCGEDTEAGNDGDCGFGTQQAHDVFPIQFDDFFILSLGKVDVRPTYHTVNQIWPVGYKSNWHDKITGSLFSCEVTSGGDSGPAFKVGRRPCSTMPIPAGSTVIVRSKDHLIVQNSDKNGNLDPIADCDKDDSIQMILLDPSPPSEDDIISCLLSSSNKAFAAELSGSLQPDSFDVLETEVGEIFAEGCSPSSSWAILSQKLIDACSDALKRNHTFKFHCNHVNKDLEFSCYNEKSVTNKALKAGPTLLAKFCSSPGYVDVPTKYAGDNELETIANSLSKWLDHDRFGLDTLFVQELIEKLPGAQSCSKYENVCGRNHSLASPTFSNGALVVQNKSEEEFNLDIVSNDLLRTSKKRRSTEDYETDSPLPPGKLMCLRIPPTIVSEFYQVWELLWRFHEILGLKEPFSLKELEDELINPWSGGLDFLENSKRKLQGHKILDSHIMDEKGEKRLSLASESLKGVPVDNQNIFIQMETEASKEAALEKLASVTYGRCCGVALTKVHFSLLNVLISELQTKVAALVDPNFDAGESKSKRGRKKDVDTAIWERRTKLNMLPINELTWPELARRYILAVLSMDGNIESVEIITRESGKVFRCLQGDGGVLCGSLTGVAGLETDALLLAEAIKKVFGSLNRENSILTIEDQGCEPIDPSEQNIDKPTVSSEKNNDKPTVPSEQIIDKGNQVPEWAQVLEPVRKLPTNVGTRIRKCVYESLAKDPPEWAKKVLEHSISKEVYKGNASGPTKKAVLSVLADLHREEVPQKMSQKSNIDRRRKRSFSTSDIIMKKCRIILREAAAADDAKVFCTLLGRKLIISSDNDDDGLLGTPAMVSRPLDFRTIDLKLAAGAYGGSHEAFLEDVHELWNNIRIAFRDHPDQFGLAEKLSKHFEMLYENEVLTFVQKVVGYTKQDSLSSENKKEIDDLLASVGKIPKAPWDEGVCKVCGIDKDDDSVLLCDKCDAEYHTYCLNPPLARIPEGNWYCPSCVSGVNVFQEASEGMQLIRQCRSKNNQGKFTSIILDSLTQLAAVMEESEYWEFSAYERTFLLKFLCDELLNSILIRQHLEQCVETTAELQQKLRSFSMEWKNLKSREDLLAARAAKAETNAVGVNTNDKCIGHMPDLVGKVSDVSGVYDEVSNLQGIQKELGAIDPVKKSAITNDEKNHTSSSQIMDTMDTEVWPDDAHQVAVDSQLCSQIHDTSVKSNGFPLSSSLAEEGDCFGKICLQDDLQDGKGVGASSTPPLDPQGCLRTAEFKVDATIMNDSQSFQLELNTIKNDLLLLQNSIASVESQLFRLSTRREFLGTDSSGRLYWASTTSGGHPQLIVDGSLVDQEKRKNHDSSNMEAPKNSVSSGMEGSKASCPFQYNTNDLIYVGSPWVCYQTDAEIKEVINSFKNSDPKERELKESISLWRRVKLRELQETESQNVDDHLPTFSMPMDREVAYSNRLCTKAALVLESQHGPCFEFECFEFETSKKQVNKARLSTEDKMYRCECLEPIWPSRYHCLSCHRTLSTAINLEGHDDGKCIPVTLQATANEKSNELIYSELKSRRIKFQDEGLICPFDFDEIRSKFLTKDSNEELVQEIGFIRSNGNPSFIPSRPPFFDDSAILLIPPQKDQSVSSNEFKTNEKLSFPERNSSNPGRHSVSCNSSRRSSSGITRKFLEGGLGHCVIPRSSLRPLSRKVSGILRRLKINLFDMEAALPEEAIRASKAQPERRCAWRAFVKSAESIYEMVQATIVLEDMIKSDYLRNEWWYWSSLSAAVKTSTISSLALRIYSLDAATVYEKTPPPISSDVVTKSSSLSDWNPLLGLDIGEKSKISKKSNNRKRKELAEE